MKKLSPRRNVGSYDSKYANNLNGLDKDVEETRDIILTKRESLKRFMLSQLKDKRLQHDTIYHSVIIPIVKEIKEELDL